MVGGIKSGKGEKKVRAPKRHKFAGEEGKKAKTFILSRAQSKKFPDKRYK